MNSYDDKILTSSTPTMVPTGSKHAVTRTYPKSGQEQSLTKFEPGVESPRGTAVTTTYPKSGQKQSI